MASDTANTAIQAPRAARALPLSLSVLPLLLLSGARCGALANA
jgi:hypothetical protein